MRHVVMFSGGAGSWAAAKRVAERHGTEHLTLLFTDTLMEDEDLYRFLIEGAANVTGRTDGIEPLLRMAAALPPIEDEARSIVRRAMLRALASAAMQAIPELVWIAEGRTPWEVFFDERFLGNSRVDPCSRVLKREKADRWLAENFDPAITTVYVGIDWTEEHHYTRAPGTRGPNDKGGLKERKAEQGWHYEAPMCEAPYMTKDGVLDWLRSEGVKPPRLYPMGFGHNNCGGFCCKAGKGHFANLLRVMPVRYAYHERKEQEIRRHLGRLDIAILTEQVNKEERLVTLKELRERIEAGEQIDLLDIGGCGCFLDEAA